MNKLPQVYGLVLCEKARVEKAPARFCLDGFFVVREFASFPTPVVSFMAYACFFDGRGEGLLQITCTQLEGEKDIYYHKRWYAFPRKIPTLHYLQLVRPAFREPGRYALTLSFDQVPLTVRYLDVKQRR